MQKDDAADGDFSIARRQLSLLHESLTAVLKTEKRRRPTRKRAIVDRKMGMYNYRGLG